MNLFKRKPKEGTVSKAEHERIVAEEVRKALNQQRNFHISFRAGLHEDLEEARADVLRLTRERNVALEALEQIAAQVTPGANATVKRMGAIAQKIVDARPINQVLAALEEPQSRDKQQAEVGA